MVQFGFEKNSGLFLLKLTVLFPIWVEARDDSSASSHGLAFTSTNVQNVNQMDYQTYQNKHALYEEEIMSSTQELLLMPKAIPNEPADTKSDQSINGTQFKSMLLEELKADGVVRIDQILTPETTTQLLSYVNQKKIDTEMECITKGWVSNVEDSWLCRNRFANVLSKNNRWDLLLPLPDNDEIDSQSNSKHASTSRNDVLMQSLDEMVGENAILGKIIENYLGLNAELYEFATLFSDSGSERQVLHPDIPALSPPPPLLTCFIALQNVDCNMGPTTFVPKSYLPQYHDALRDPSEHPRMLRSVCNKIALLNGGDCTLFDPRTLHAGGANKSDLRRCLFVISFRNPALEDPGASNNPGSLRPELKHQKMTLTVIREMIEVWKKERKS